MMAVQAWHSPRLGWSGPLSSSSSSPSAWSSPEFLSFSYATGAFQTVSLRRGNVRRTGGSAATCTLSTLSEPLQENDDPSPPSPAPPQAPEKKKSLRQLILKPPLSDTKLAERYLNSPQLQLKTFPVLSSCLPLQQLKKEDHEWMDQYLLEAKNALGYSLDVLEPREDVPASHLDSLLFLAFNHERTVRGKTKWVGTGHSRLCFLGQFVIELAFCELVLQMYPRERVGQLRERVFNLTSKKVLPYWFKQASLDRLMFPTDELLELKGHQKQLATRDVFWALVAVSYLTLGMPEVYRLLFEVFGMDLDAPTAQPTERDVLEDIDHLSPDLETQKTWQDIAYYKAPADSLFAHPLLFRACVPPGVHRFRRNGWESMSLPKVKQMLGYPLPRAGSSPEVTEARNLEVDLGLQLSFLHPSKYKGDHPRFCYDRLEYLGSKIKDVIGAEDILMKHLDGPGRWLNSKHRLQFLNRICGRTLREKKLHFHILYDEERKDQSEQNRRFRNFSTTSVQHGIHGLGYAVYGRLEVKRLIGKVFTIDELIPSKYL